MQKAPQPGLSPDTASVPPPPPPYPPPCPALCYHSSETFSFLFFKFLGARHARMPFNTGSVKPIMACCYWEEVRVEVVRKQTNLAPAATFNTDESNSANPPGEPLSNVLIPPCGLLL